MIEGEEPKEPVDWFHHEARDPVADWSFVLPTCGLAGALVFLLYLILSMERLNFG